LSLTTYRSTVVLSFSNRMPFSKWLRRSIWTTHCAFSTYHQYAMVFRYVVLVLSRTTLCWMYVQGRPPYSIYINRAETELGQNHRLASTVPPSNKIAPTIDLFGNDGTWCVYPLSRRIFWRFNVVQRTPYTREIRVTNLSGSRSPPTYCASEARMTQMGRSCTSDQKTGKTVLLHPNVLSIALKWSRIKLSTHPRVCCRLHHWRTSSQGRSAYERQQFCGGTTYSWTIKVADDGFISAANICKRWCTVHRLSKTHVQKKRSYRRYKWNSTFSRRPILSAVDFMGAARVINVWLNGSVGLGWRQMQ
jgi:hypothetical protein